VEILRNDSDEAEVLPSLSIGLVVNFHALAIDESESERGQVLLIVSDTFIVEDEAASMVSTTLTWQLGFVLRNLLRILL